jgi:hypothetical protein
MDGTGFLSICPASLLGEESVDGALGELPANREIGNGLAALLEGGFPPKFNAVMES